MRKRLVIRENYGFLLLGLLVLFLLVPLTRSLSGAGADMRIVKITVQVGFCLMMLIGVWSLSRERTVFWLGLGMAALSAGFATAQVFVETKLLEMGTAGIVLIFSTTSGFIAARHVFTCMRVDRNLLYGAVCVYLLIGLVWAVLFGLVIELDPAAFQGVGLLNGNLAFDDLLYYSFVTLASLGYGDITPLAPLARTLAYLEAITGQFYLAIMVAGLVGLYMRDRGAG